MAKKVKVIVTLWKLIKAHGLNPFKTLCDKIDELEKRIEALESKKAVLPKTKKK